MAGRLSPEEILSQVNHRPWSVRTDRWVWRQSWCDLLFMHWPVKVDLLRPLVPEQLKIQEFDGTSYLGIVPFRMEGVMRRPFPDLPWFSTFPELNVRLYVEHRGRPGVFFLSLDATNPFVVWAGRTIFHLPYYRASMKITEENGVYHYFSLRKDLKNRSTLMMKYQPTSQVYFAKKGTLDHFLTERYCLYTVSPKGELTRVDVHHPPWPLQSATAEIDHNSLLANTKLVVPGTKGLLHFAKRVDVVTWNPELSH